MFSRLVNSIVWLLVAGSVAIITGGLLGRPVFLAAVPTTSMVPVLSPGDLIPVVPMWGVRPHVGQIVVFRTEKDSTWIVHRIVAGSAQTGFTTKGDANPVPDPYPIYPKNIAGFVPTVGHVTFHVPRLGSMSAGRGPLSSPLVAGAALLCGLYLLISDARSGLQRVRFKRLRRLRPPALSSGTVAVLYVGLALAAFVVTLFTSFSLGQTQTATFRVITFRPDNVKIAAEILVGEEKTDSITVHNGSPLPLVMVLASSDPDLTWDHFWLILPPRQEHRVAVTAHGGAPGAHTALLRQAVYLPLLPPAWLVSLSYVNWELPAFATALMPALIIAAIAAFDTRVGLEMQSLRLKLLLRLRL